MWDKFKNYALMALMVIIGVLSVRARIQAKRIRVEELKNAGLKDKEKRKQIKEEVAKLSDDDLLAEYDKLMGNNA